VEAFVTRRISRRNLLAAGGSLCLGACARAEQGYFGKTDPPRTQRLVYLLDHEPGSLDPALGFEEPLTLSLFEGLTVLHPATGIPIAGLATHYDISPDGLRYTFFLRGHPQPGGTPLGRSGDLPEEFSHGRVTPPVASQATWSDSVPISAHDFVYSWRRAVDPTTGARFAFLLHDIRHALEVTVGKAPPSHLDIQALDDFTLQVELVRPTPAFLELVSGAVFCPVPRHAIQAFGRDWTDPGRIVSSGAFLLKERRLFDRIVLAKNPAYYESGQVALKELTFVIVRDDTARLNLYKAGIGAMVQPWVPTIMPVLRRKKDFRPQAQYASLFWVVNTSTPPLNDVRVRYALNMATDKRPIADLAAAGAVPCYGLVPETADYPSLRSLPVTLDGTIFDVLSFNPEAARALLAKTAHPLTQRLEYFCSTTADSLLWAAILKDQWARNLGIELDVRPVEFTVAVEANVNGRFRHVSESGAFANYVDPACFLELFSRPGAYGSFWSDPLYNRIFTQARETSDRALRMTRLAQCERLLLEAMPILPLGQEVQAKMRKPFVKGLGSNLLNREQFKYAWIDTQWRPQ
jgi:ABC-type oligopeptide transport system substrate-binding subunit